MPNWYVCLLDAMILTIVLSSTLALYSYVFLDSWTQTLVYKPYWIEPITEYLPMIYAVPFVYKIDILIKGSIIFHSWLNKKMMETISKIDHKIWKKTGKDSYLSDKMWKGSKLFAKIPKRQRNFLIACFMSLYFVWYITQFII